MSAQILLKLEPYRRVKQASIKRFPAALIGYADDH